MTDYQMSNGGVLVPSPITVKGVYHGQIIRDGKIIDEWDSENIVVTEGLNHLLSIELAGGSPQITAWYLAPFEGNYTPVATVTAATITSASTECTAYTQSTRQAWTAGAVSAGAVSNSGSPATFTFNASKTIYGAFLVSSSTKSSTSGTLFSASAFASSKSVTSGDQLLLTYSFSVSSS